MDSELLDAKLLEAKENGEIVLPVLYAATLGLKSIKSEAKSSKTYGISLE